MNFFDNNLLKNKKERWLCATLERNVMFEFRYKEFSTELGNVCKPIDLKIGVGL